MNFKIEINYINIDNYPFMERFFEKKAREGWLISKIYQGYIFVYKRIKPEDLDFSITPYEIETFFTRKTKVDLEEFQSVCQHVGWNYATKTSDLHIYYKEKTDDAMPLETDEEELFKSLEAIGKKQEVGNYLMTILSVVLSWFILGSVFKNTSAVKDGLHLSLAFLMPAALALGIVQIIDLNRFINRNRKNIEEGLPLDFDSSRKPIYKILLIYMNIVFILLFYHILYSAFILENKSAIIGLIPGIIGVSIGTLYRFIVKPRRMELELKSIGLVFTLLLTIALNAFIGVHFIDALLDQDQDLPDREDYKIVLMEDLDEGEDYATFYRNSSPLFPHSYESYSYSRSAGSIKAEYAGAINSSIAQNLVKRYKNRAKKALVTRTNDLFRYSFDYGEFDSFLKFYGINEEDFNKVKDMDKIEGKRKLREVGFANSIIKADESFWGVDEAYYLDYMKTEIILRKDREVIYIDLEGMDFLDDHIENTIKNRLSL